MEYCSEYPVVSDIVSGGTRGTQSRTGVFLTEAMTYTLAGACGFLGVRRAPCSRCKVMTKFNKLTPSSFLRAGQRFPHATRSEFSDIEPCRTADAVASDTVTDSSKGSRRNSSSRVCVCVCVCVCVYRCVLAEMSTLPGYRGTRVAGTIVLEYSRIKELRLPS